jgi:hypothetical protein
VPSGSGEGQALLRQFAVLVRVFEKPIHSRRVKRRMRARSSA